MNSLLQDLRYATRTLAKSPGFTAAAVLTLALGIGGNSAIFSVVHAVLLRSLPFSEPDRLVQIAERRSTSRTSNIPVSGHEYKAWAEENHTLESIAFYGYDTLNLTTGGEPQSVAAIRVTSGFLPLMGLQTALGRGFAPGEDQADTRVVVLSESLWRRRFGADSNIVGRAINLNDQNYTIIGVSKPVAKSLEPDLWLPINLPLEIQRMGKHSSVVVGKLKAGVTVAQAQADLDVIAGNLARKFPNDNTDHNVKVIPMHEAIVGDVSNALWVLFGAVGFVLLIACVNVANLLLARAASRNREIAIRTALGAGRWRLVRQFLTESVLLSLLGGGLGLLLAMWLTDLFPTIKAVRIPLLEGARVDGTVLAATFGFSLLTGMLSGIAPAISSSRPKLSRWLNEGSRMSAEPGRRRLGGVLVASEVALAVVLLLGCGLMMRGFLALMNVDPGFNPRNVLVVQLVLPGSKYATAQARRMFFDRLVESIQSVPGVVAVGGTSNLPLGTSDNWMPIGIVGRPDPPPGQVPYAQTRVVTADYFRAMAIPLRAGRFFNASDARISLPLIRWFPTQPKYPDFDKSQPAPVAIISEMAVKQFFPNQDPIGRQIRVLFSPPLTIVGVVGDVHHNGLAERTYPNVYISYAQEPWAYQTLAVRVSGDPLQQIGAVRDRVRAMDGALPISVTPMLEVYSDSVGQQRFYVALISVFGGLALLLAVVGIFGVVSYSVTQRIREIGVRMALGAQRADILKLIVGRGMAPTIIGVGVGVAVAAFLTRFIEKLIFNVNPVDPATFIGVCLLLTGVAALACYVPARRATKVDPMVALRYE